MHYLTDPNPQPATAGRLARRLRTIALAVLSAACLAGPGAARDGAPPFVMFASDWDKAAVAAVYDTLGSEDFVSHSVSDDWAKAGRKPVPRVFSLPANLRSTQQWIGRGCAADRRPEIIVYDPEQWEHTPPEEQADLPGSIARAASAVRGGGCFSFGLAPGGSYVSEISGRCRREPTPLLDHVDWKAVDLFIVQTQALVTETCGGVRNIPEYVRFMTSVVNRVRAVNPSIRIVTAMSFAHTSPATMKAAVAGTRGLVDGYYLAYPKVDRCKHCTPANLRSVIRTVKGRP